MKTLAIIKYLFASIGLGLFAIGINSWFSTRDFLAHAIKTEGRVIDVIRTVSTDRDSNGKRKETVNYYPVALFTDQSGIERKFHSDTSSSSYNPGDRIDIVYLPNKPETARINDTTSLYALPIIMGFMGTLFLGFGGGLIAHGIFKKRRAAELMQSGTVVEAKFTGVEFNTSLTVNGRHPYMITAQWQDPVSQLMYQFESDNIWFDPSDFIEQEYLRVYIDSKNPRRHHMDISFLPKMAH